MTAVYRFGRYELRPAARQLLSGQQTIALGGRAFDLLVALVERRDRLVVKNELLDLAWPGLVVEENNLTVQVSALRKVLGADAIATIPGRGYRFTLPVTATESAGEKPPPMAPEAAGPPAAQRPAELARSPTRSRWWFVVGAAILVFALVTWQMPRWRPPPPPAFSVAVMPLSPAGESPELEQFIGAATPVLLATIGKSPFTLAAARRTPAYSNARDMRSIGSELNVRYLVDGTVSASDGQAVITVHLIEAESGTHVWTHRSRPAVGGTAFGAAAADIGMRLRSAVYESEKRRALAHPDSGSAIGLMLQGDIASANAAGSVWDRRAAARKYYDAALAVDPNLVPVLDRIATILDDKLLQMESDDAGAIAQTIDEYDRISLRMVAADEASPAAWYQRAQALIWQGRLDQALAANAKAHSLAVVTNVAVVAQRTWILQLLDRPLEALAMAEQAAAIPPLDKTGQEGFAVRMVCQAKLLLGRYKEAAVECEKSAARDDAWFDHAWLAAAYAQMGNRERAAAETAALLKAKPEFTIAQFERGNAGTPEFRKRREEHIVDGLRKAGIPER